jgi:hypothetical protein
MTLTIQIDDPYIIESSISEKTNLNTVEIIISKESTNQFSLTKTIFIKSINTDLPIIVSSVYSANQLYVLRYNSSAGIEIR